VGALEKAGLISIVGGAITASVQNEVLLRILILWSSGILSAFMGAVPIVTAFIPLVENLGRELSIPPERLAPLWWSLALGGSLGGIGTILGTAANMVVTGISERTRHRITYKSYLIVGFPIMIIALIISTGYILLRYRAP
jgi:Na+/H+ antiporter NhaD/arsenite permease-like protein